MIPWTCKGNGPRSLLLPFALSKHPESGSFGPQSHSIIDRKAISGKYVNAYSKIRAMKPGHTLRNKETGS